MGFAAPAYSRGCAAGVIAAGLAGMSMIASVGQGSAGDSGELWTFDRLDRIGGYETAVLGNPRVIDTPGGKAIQFDGVDDAVVVGVHPLAGAASFTWEAIFRPEGGEPAQRWFHLQETGSDNRMLFEIRVLDSRWYFDSFVHSGVADKALINRERLHRLGAWYHVAAVYDGREFRNYVNGEQEGAAAIRFDPQGPGRSSIGVRMNLVNYFRGAVRLARFSRRALAPNEFLTLAVSERAKAFGHGGIDRNFVGTDVAPAPQRFSQHAVEHRPHVANARRFGGR
jgi:hypothetical protein